MSDRWLPVTPTGRLDGFEWKLPLAEIGVSRPVIEVTPPPAPAAEPAIKIATPEAKAEPVSEISAEPERAREPAKPTEKPAAKAKPIESRSVEPKPVEPVIPLLHAPDDPGPDSGLDGDPVPEPTTPPAGDAWQRIRQLFR